MVGALTEETSSGPGRRACRARDRPWSSRRRRALSLRGIVSIESFLFHDNSDPETAPARRTRGRLEASSRHWRHARGPLNWWNIKHRPGNLRSTKPTNLPAGPPILFKVLPTPLAAPAMAGPAALDTLLSPWLALLADSLAASVAFSVEVDWKRRVARRRVGDRRARRAADMMGEGVFRSSWDRTDCLG